MIKRYVVKLFINNRAFILSEVLAIKGLMQLLMKPRNTGEKWTGKEKKQIRQHLKTICMAIPAIIIFLPPGGGLLLPLLVDVLDRRNKVRSP